MTVAPRRTSAGRRSSRRKVLLPVRRGAARNRPGARGRGGRRRQQPGGEVVGQGLAGGKMLTVWLTAWSQGAACSSALQAIIVAYSVATGLPPATSEPVAVALLRNQDAQAQVVGRLQLTPDGLLRGLVGQQRVLDVADHQRQALQRLRRRPGLSDRAARPSARPVSGGRTAGLSGRSLVNDTSATMARSRPWRTPLGHRLPQRLQPVGLLHRIGPGVAQAQQRLLAMVDQEGGGFDASHGPAG